MTSTCESSELTLHPTSPRIGLLDLPLEIRQQIFGICIAKRGKTQYYDTLTLVCWQLRLDALSILLKEGPHFFRLERFINWVTSGPPGLLECVRSISLRVYLESSYDYMNYSLINFNPFLSIPKLRSLRLHVDFLPKTRGRTRRSIRKRMRRQEKFLLVMASSCPDLESLELPYIPANLSFLVSLQNLQHLCWTGYSLSTPEETLSILNTLPSLSSLSIRCNYSNIDLYEKKLNFTGYVLENIKPLKRLEISHKKNRLGRPDLLTHEILQALATHRDALRDLDITHNGQIDQIIWGEVLHILSSFSLTRIRLHLFVPRNLYVPDIDSCIGPTIRHCEIMLFVNEGQERVSLHTLYLR